ncbi:MAG: MFS transporter [Lachnospiraceae bacterium]|nr:MFS transporter [Lachnospiraceae bacterium]
MNNWKKNVALFLTSQAISLFGSSVVSFAIVWFITRQTHSGLWVSLLTVSSYLPQFLVSFFAGVWADRYSRKKLIIVADTMIAAFTCLLVLLFPRFTNIGIMMAALIVISFIRSVGAGVQTPAVSAMIPSLVPEDKLMKINGYNASIQSAVQFAAPAAAGLVLSFMPLSAVLMIDIVTAVIGVGILCFVAVPVRETTETSQDVENSSMFADLKKGFSYVLSEYSLRYLILSFGLFILLCVPAGFLCSLYVTRYFSDSYIYLSGVELAGFAGMTAGGLIMASFAGKRDRMKIYGAGIAGFGVLSVLLASIDLFPVYLVLMVLYGVILTIVQTASTTFIQENAKEDMIGRVFGLYGSVYSLALPLGMIVFGPLADFISLKVLMVASGIVLAVLGFYTFMKKKM